MPNKIQMILSNNQTFNQSLNQSLRTRAYTAPVVAPSPVVAPKNLNTGFKSSMIGRIHTIKPGCGSCGR